MLQGTAGWTVTRMLLVIDFLALTAAVALLVAVEWYSRCVFALLWWFRLNTFWPFIYLLWRNIWFFFWCVCVFCLSVVELIGSLYIFNAMPLVCVISGPWVCGNLSCPRKLILVAYEIYWNLKMLWDAGQQTLIVCLLQLYLTSVSMVLVW